MRWRISTWRAPQLLAAWAVYWSLLLLVGLGSAVPAIMRINKPDAKGSASINFGDQGFAATILEGKTEVWHAHMTVFALSMLIAVPPLIIWGIWLFSHRGQEPPPPALPEEMAEPIVPPFPP